MPIQWSVELYESVKSTQDIIKGMARLGQAEGHVIQAYEQKNGYGRHGRHWVSERGNVYVSVLLRPDCKAQNVPELSLVAGLSVAKTLEQYVDAQAKVSLKWPNDVFLNDAKCAGILLETEITQSGNVQWLALGMGINIASAPDGVGHAASDYSQVDIDLIDFRQSLLKNFEKDYSSWLSADFSALRDDWLSRVYNRDTPIEVKIGPQIERGFFHDVDAKGNLILRDTEFRTKKISAGEIHFLEQNT